MYYGRFTLGQFVPLSASCVDGDSDPGAPTYAPTVKVYESDGTRILSSKMPPVDRYVVDGLFNYRLRLGDDYATGHYMVSVSWVIGGSTFIEAGNFEIVAGGHEDGAVTAVVEYRTPAGTHLVQRLDSDQRVLARGPGV